MSLEQRVLALEARVMALESRPAAPPPKTKRTKFPEPTHLNFGMDLLSLIEDHIEVLKLVHTIVPPADHNNNKLVLGYIRRAERKLDQFQSRLAQADEMRKRHENGVTHNPSVPVVKQRGVSLPKLSDLNRLLRSASRRGWTTIIPKTLHLCI